MKKDKLVSIVIPVYQVEQYIDKCLMTVTQQTYSNLEIILVDDGSKDSSPLICDKWAHKDQRIKVIHKKNGGLSDARNVGLSMAIGDYVAFIDSDDWVSTSMIEKLVTSIEDTDADMAVCQFVRVFSNGKVQKNPLLGVRKQVFNRKNFLKYLLKDSAITNHVWRKLYKRRIIPNNVFPKGKTFEDIYAMPSIVEQCKKIVCIDDVEYFYRMNNEGIAHSASIDQIWDRYTAIKHAYYYTIKLEPSLNIEADTMLVQKLVGIAKEIYDSENKTINDDRRRKLIVDIKKNIEHINNTAIRKLGKRDRLFYYFLFNLSFMLKPYFYLIGSNHSKLMKLKGNLKKHSIYGNRHSN